VSVLYPSVYRAHIVPKGYLRSFAIDGKIAVRKVGETTSDLKPVERAGTRPRFYRRTRPNGTKIDDIEWSLSHIEDKAAPILRGLDDLWPLGDHGKSVLAELFGYQLVRGPRWADWHEAYVRELLRESRQVLLEQGESVEELEAHLPKVDLLLVMTIQPGFGGQPFRPELVEKVRRGRSWADIHKPDLHIEVDGGINPKTAKVCIENGANVLVAGTAVFHTDDYETAISALRGDRSV